MLFYSKFYAVPFFYIFEILSIISGSLEIVKSLQIVKSWNHYKFVESLQIYYGAMA